MNGAVVDARSAHVSNIVFAKIRSVPRDRAVVDVIVEDGQAVIAAVAATMRSTAEALRCSPAIAI